MVSSILAAAALLAAMAPAEAKLPIHNFPLLVHTFSMDKNNEHAFKPLPRTIEEIDNEGWVQLSSCEDGPAQFPGDRFARSKEDNDIVIVLDENGYLAGVQSIVPIKYTENNKAFDLTKDKYVEGDFFGADVMYESVWLVEPKIVCNGGRTKEEWEAEGSVGQGTGAIYLQHGENPEDSKDLIPLWIDQRDMTADPQFTKRACFFLMGVHYIGWDGKHKFDCDNPADYFPLQIMYNNGRLDGFVFTHSALVPGPRWEAFNEGVMSIIFPEGIPQCMIDRSHNPGIHTMHIFVDDWHTDCDNQPDI